LPPSFSIAVSKLRRVRVLGSKNRVARILPLSRSDPVSARGSIVLATSSI
jgi:hypothetical protein